MNNLKKSLDIINNLDGELINLNILFNLDKKYYKTIFDNLTNQYKNISTFDEIKNINKNITELNSIIYIYYYIVDKKNSYNHIFFNIKNLKENNENIENTINNKQDLININIINNNNNTLKVKNNIINNDNLIKKFINKQNNKSKLSINLWKNNNINENNEKINLKKLYYKNQYDSKEYVQIDNYNLKVIRKINIEIDNEKIITNLRLSIPNSFIIYFNDGTYFFLNKIIISSSKSFNNLIFQNINEKINYIINLYIKIFDINSTVLFKNLKYILSFKYKNNDNILLNSLLYKNIFININKHNIIFTKYIIIKYIKNFDELKNVLLLIDKYKKRYNLINNILNQINNNNLLYYNDDLLNSFFKLYK